MSDEYKVFPSLTESNDKSPLVPGSKGRIWASTPTLVDNPHYIPATGKHSKPSPLPVSMFMDQGHTPFTRTCKICQREMSKEEPTVHHVCGYAFHAMCMDVYLKNSRAKGSHCRIIVCPACDCLLENRESVDGQSGEAAQPTRSNTAKSLQRAGGKIVQVVRRALTLTSTDPSTIVEVKPRPRKDLKLIDVSEPSRVSCIGLDGIPQRRPLPKDAKVQVTIGSALPFLEPSPVPPKDPERTATFTVREREEGEPSGDLTEQIKYEEHSDVFYY